MYSRSQNSDETLNTRCLYCFLTIAANVEDKKDLDRIEAKHFCPEKAFAEMVANEDTTKMRRSPRHLSLGGGGGDA